MLTQKSGIVLGLAQVIGRDGEARPLSLETVAPRSLARGRRPGCKAPAADNSISSRRFSSVTDASPWFPHEARNTWPGSSRPLRPAVVLDLDRPSG